LRWEAKRHTALDEPEFQFAASAAEESKAVSPLRSATALHNEGSGTFHRFPDGMEE